MGIFNRSIPTYTVDTANNIRITKPLPEEEPNTYIDDAFDPILNKAVRERLISQWGNPISATLAGYHEMLNNALVGSTKQWGPLGPGMGILGSFGRTMDKGGDLIIGGLTEGIKGVTGQGIESPFYNIFTKDEDYTGGKLLAAMGNSMAKLADAPELTEEDFDGIWKLPAIGIELATDPGILGGTLAKAGGAVGKRSSAEILQNLGKADNSVLADVGQLLSNYDDAMTKVALDVTAPGLRQSIKKLGPKLHKLIPHSSRADYVDTDLSPIEIYAERIEKAEAAGDIDALRQIHADMQTDQALQMQMQLEDAVEANTKKQLAPKFPKPKPDNTSTPVQAAPAQPAAKPKTDNAPKVTYLQHSKHGKKIKSYALKKRIMTSEGDFEEYAKELNSYVNQFKDIEDSIANQKIDRTLFKHEIVEDNVTYDYTSDFKVYKHTLVRPDGTRIRYMDVAVPDGAVKVISPKRSKIKFLSADYKTLSPIQKLEYLSENINFFKNANADLKKAFKTEVNSNLNILDKKYPLYAPVSESGKVTYTIKRKKPKKALYEAAKQLLSEHPNVELSDAISELRNLRSELDRLPLTYTKTRTKIVDGINRLKTRIHKLQSNISDPNIAKAYDVVQAYEIPEDINIRLSERASKILTDYADNAEVTNLLKQANSDLTYLTVDNRGGLDPASYQHGGDKMSSELVRTLAKLDSRAARAKVLKYYNKTPEEFKELVKKDNIYRKDLAKDTNAFNEHYTSSKAQHDRVVSTAINRVGNPQNFYDTADVVLTNDETVDIIDRILVDDDAYVEQFVTPVPKKNNAEILNDDSEYDLNDPNGIITNPEYAISNTPGLITALTDLRDDLISEDPFAKANVDLKDYIAPYIDNQTAKRQIDAFIDDGIVKAKFGEAPITVSPSLVYNTRDSELVKNAVRIGEKRLKRILSDWLPVDTINSPDVFYELIRRDPGMLQIFTPDWRINEYIDTLNLLFRQRGLPEISITAPNLKRNFFEVIKKYPYLEEALGIKNAFIEDIGDVMFGRLRKIRPKDAPKYTVHTQLQALDDFTKKILEHINIKALRDTSPPSIIANKVLQELGPGVYIRDVFPKEIFDTIRDQYNYYVDYDTFINETQNALYSIANGSLYQSLHNYAKYMQKNIFEPLHYTVNKERADMLDLLNKSIVSHPGTFKSIADVKDFITPVSDVAKTAMEFMDTPYLRMKGTESVNELAFYSNKLPDVAEIKFKDLGSLQLKGSSMPSYIEEYALYRKTPEYKKTSRVPKHLYPLHKYLKDHPEQKDLIVAIFKTSNETGGDLKTISQIAKSVNKEIDADLVKLFNKIDLTPHYVEDIVYNVDKSIGNNYIRHATAVKQLTKKPPEELIQAPIVTSNDIAVKTVIEENGLEEVAKDVKQITGGGDFEDLTPDQKEILSDRHGEDFRLSDLVHKARVSKTRAQYTKDNIAKNKLGTVLSDQAKKLNESEDAANNLLKYSIIQDAEQGDILDYRSLTEELVTAKKPVGKRFSSKSVKAADALQKSLEDYTNFVNGAAGFNMLKVYRNVDGDSTFVAVMFDLENLKKTLKFNFKNVKYDDTAKVVFEAIQELPDKLATFKTTQAYIDNDEFVKGMSAYTQDIYKRLGFDYTSKPVHLKHVLNSESFKNAPLLANFYKGVDLDTYEELCERLLSSDSFNHLYGTFGAVPFGRSLRGGSWNYNFKGHDIFDYDPEHVLSSTLAEGVLSNTNVQSFVGLFMNDNFKLSTYFKTAEDLERVLYLKGPDGKLSGNFYNLDVIAPVYDSNGKILRFKRFDKASRTSLEAALKTEDAILVPSGIVAPLDVWCKHNAKMSNRIYRFFNKYFSLPYKFGVLANPGFILGNLSDAHLKQATTMSEKYGTSISEEAIKVAESLREVYVLNNKFADTYKVYIESLKDSGLKIPPLDYPITALNSNPKARQRFADWLSGTLTDSNGKVIKPKLSADDIDTSRLWLYLNSVQPTKSFGNGVRDINLDKSTIKDTNIIERIFYGSKKYDPKKPQTWGVFLNNPISRSINTASETLEAYYRSANVLNALKHQGYDSAALKKLLGETFDEDTARMLHFETENALNAMYNANFNYEIQSELMDKMGYAIPFPTFFIDNFSYWMQILVDHPEYIDSAITIQEGLWSDRKDEVEEDVFMAEAKGRGAVPINNGDGQGLSKFFRGIYKPTPLNSMFSAFNLLNHPIENLTNRVHPLINTPMQLVQGKLGEHEVGLATYSDAENVKYRPYSTNRFERNRDITDDNFNPVSFAAHKLNPYDRAIGNTLRFPNKLAAGDVQLSDVIPSVFQPDF